jgi:hypothetical protein
MTIPAGEECVHASTKAQCGYVNLSSSTELETCGAPSSKGTLLRGYLVCKLISENKLPSLQAEKLHQKKLAHNQRPQNLQATRAEEKHLLKFHHSNTQLVFLSPSCASSTLWTFVRRALTSTRNVRCVATSLSALEGTPI